MSGYFQTWQVPALGVLWPGASVGVLPRRGPPSSTWELNRLDAYRAPALLQMMMGGAASPCRVPSIGQGGDGPTSSQIGGWKPPLFRETKRASRHAHTPRLPRWTSCSLSEPEECPDRTLRLRRLRHAALQLDRTTSPQPLTRQIFRCIQSHRTAMSSSLIIALHCYDRLSGSKTAPWLLGLHPRMGRHLALLANANLGHQT